MSTTTEYVFKEDGRCFRRNSEEHELNLNGLSNKLTGTLITRIPRLADSAWGPVGLAVQSGVYRFTVNIKRLRLSMPIDTEQGGIVFPNFTLGANLPQATFEWEPKREWGMTLRVMIMVQGSAITGFDFSMMWLFAMDQEHRTYKLPLPNLHDDLHMCVGKFNNTSDSLMEVFRRTMENFDSSQWNDHLWTEPNETQQLFRWKPLPDGFQTLYPDGDWRKLCKKVGVESSNFLIL